jgi:hypothetical protein
MIACSDSLLCRSVTNRVPSDPKLVLIVEELVLTVEKLVRQEQVFVRREQVAARRDDGIAEREPFASRTRQVPCGRGRLRRAAPTLLRAVRNAFLPWAPVDCENRWRLVGHVTPKEKNRQGAAAKTRF